MGMHVLITCIIIVHVGPQCGTAESIFSKMDSVLHTNQIPWGNCVGVGVDNTSVNMGKANSIMTRVKQQNPAAYFMGCPCHIMHNMATKASESFTAVSCFLSIIIIIQQLINQHHACIVIITLQSIYYLLYNRSPSLMSKSS